MRNIDIIAACSDLGVHVDGSNLGPEKLVQNIIPMPNIKRMLEIHYDSNYIKELDANNKKKNLDQVNLFNRDLYKEVSRSLDLHSLPIVLRGRS